MVLPPPLLAGSPQAPVADDSPSVAPAAEAPNAVNPAVNPEEPTPAAPSAATLLHDADQALDARDAAKARVLYGRIVAEFPGTVEAQSAARALKIMKASTTSESLPASTPEGEGEPQKAPASNPDTFYRLEPYSALTAERLNISTWEKIDFVTTAFVYGASVGLSFTMAADSNDSGEVVLPIIAGATIYTGLALGYLSAAKPDRGDLPLALGISSYVPLTALLLTNTSPDWSNAKTKSLVVALAGTVAVPAAAIAAYNLNLDPGDTQFVRDAAFWGLALSVLGTEAWGGTTVASRYADSYRSPSTRTVSVAGLVGLYGGLGLGILGASAMHPSLERVRAATWGGYGGLVLGALFGMSMKGDQDMFGSLTVGGLLGVGLTFGLTSSLDVIPEGTPLIGGKGGSPAIMSVLDTHGHPMPAYGLQFELP